MPIQKSKILLILVLLLAFILRAYQLDSYPPLNPDEAAIGYNTFSLLQTGKDEHGNSWPIHFKSFGDYKPGGYFYLALPFVKILGLTPLAVRLPNLIFSVLAIYFIYKLVLLLSSNTRLSILSSLALAVSPWHLHFSRGAWESSVALSLIIIGTYYFYSYIKTKNILNLFIFSVLFSLSLYTYHSARIFAPLLAVFLLLSNFKTFINQKKLTFTLFIFTFLICLPVLFSFLLSGGSARFGGVGLTADQGPLWRSNELLNQHHNTLLVNRVIHNRRVLYLLSWVDKYLSHFNLNFLYISGDEVPRSKIPEMGQLYPIGLPFLLFGLYSLLRSKIYDLRSKIFVICWLLISPLASSLTFQAPSALRSLPLVIPLEIITALGIYFVFSSLKNILLKNLLLVCLVITFIYSFVYYLDSYYIHYQKRYPTSWNYGFAQIIPYLESQKNNYANIYFTNKYDQPYILYLFYSQYSPQKIQSLIKLSPPDTFGFSTVLQIDNIHFEKIDWSVVPDNSLVITSDEPVSQNPLKSFDFSNGSAVFKVYSK